MIYEKSNNNSRTNEGLNKSEGILWSVDKKPSLITKIKENNAVFEVDIKNGHKTGFLPRSKKYEKVYCRCIKK